MSSSKLKLCGCKEPCFVRGEQWGHFESVMCRNLYDDNVTDHCAITNEKVLMYTSQRELNR